MNISQAELDRELATARTKGWDAIFTEAEDTKGLPRGILAAVASRETNMRDVVGDGGHGRGLFQVDDRSWQEWLKAHKALAHGKKPPVRDAALFAAWLIAENMASARRSGVADEDLLKFALSSYNAGARGAMDGYRQGDSDLRTTGHDYGADVLGRFRAINGRNGGQPAPPPPPAPRQPAGDGLLRLGSQGALVSRVKERLEQWFDQAIPGEWATFGVAPGPVFDAGLEQAVRVYQERLDLEVDGIVGPQTLGSLGLVPVSATPAIAPPAELTLDQVYKKGMGGLYARAIQEWLVLRGFGLGVDGEFGQVTAKRVRNFQTVQGLPVTGQVDQTTYDALTAPMHQALAALPRASSLGATAVTYARAHLAQGAREVQSKPNDGPWVRLYMDGRDGPDWFWCAGFATYVLKQAAATMGVPMPVLRSPLVDDLANDARARGSFLASPGPAARKRITPGSLYMRRDTTGQHEYAHVGIVVEGDAQSFTSIDGNTLGAPGTAVAFVYERAQDYSAKDFVLIR